MDGPCVNATILVMKCSPRPGSGAVAVDRDDGVARSLAMTWVSRNGGVGRPAAHKSGSSSGFERADHDDGAFDSICPRTSILSRLP